jgi:hypothetical protein
MPRDHRPSQHQEGNSPSSDDPGQNKLWPDQDIEPKVANTRMTMTSHRKKLLPASGPANEVPVEGARHAERRTIQDVLFHEGLKAVRLSEGLDSLGDLQQRLVAEFSQNSTETRTRYSQSVLKWFFADGMAGLARSVWLAYHDERIQSDILRYLYLSAESVMGLCVADALYPLQNGMLIPATYFDQFLRGYFGEDPPDKTKRRLKANLKLLGFLERTRGKSDRLQSVVFDKTSLLILVHRLFASDNPRTVEVSRLLADPFWKYLGCKSEDTVRNVMREADAAGLLGKYVVADQLEQVTTCTTLAEFLKRGVRL